MSMVEILTMNVHAIHMYMYLGRVPHLNVGNYALTCTWLTMHIGYLWARLTPLNTEEKQFFSSNFAQSMTGKPYSSIPWNMWIAMPLNKGSKMKAGWKSILRNEMTDTKIVNNISWIRAAIHVQVNRKQLFQRHKECAPACMSRDEQAIQDLISCLKEFNCFPIDPASPAQRSLQLAIRATHELIQDFNKQNGEAQLKLS